MAKKLREHEAQVLEIDVDESYTASEREAIAENIISDIVSRTLSGKDASGVNFKKLDKEYASFKRKAAGSSKANLKFTGDLLGALKYIKSKSGKGKITIGFKEGTKANAKAKNHITGDTLPKRNFLGKQNYKSNREIIRDAVSKFPVEDKPSRLDALKAAIALRKKLRGEKEV